MAVKVLRVDNSSHYNKRHDSWWYLDGLKYLRQAVENKNIVTLILFADEPHYERIDGKQKCLTEIIRQGYLWVEYRDEERPRKPTWIFDPGGEQFETESNGNMFAHLIRLFANGMPEEKAHINRPATRYGMLRTPL